jgi:hemerythrin-like metal-binding protein
MKRPPKPIVLPGEEQAAPSPSSRRRDPRAEPPEGTPAPPSSSGAGTPAPSSRAKRAKPTRALMPGWTDDLRVGNGTIDRQHKTFFLRALRIAVACEYGRGATEVDEAVRYFREYTILHFRDEEELMKAVGFPYLESHKDSHRAFSAKLEGFESRLHGTEDKADLAVELALWVAEWFVEHVRAADRPLARYLDDSIG